MREGSGMVRYSKEFPDRYFDVGIAEQHSVTFAAGLACEGEAGGCDFSTFRSGLRSAGARRGKLQNLPALFAIDRAGLVGADGPPTRAALTSPSCAACRT